MVLTYDAYSEILEVQRNREEDKLASIEERFNNMQLMIEKLIAVSTQVPDQQQFNVSWGTIIVYVRYVKE